MDERTMPELRRELEILWPMYEALRADNATLKAELDNIKQVEFPRRVEKVAEGWRGKCERLEDELAAVRELMNNYNLGGWTDALGPMQRALQAEAELAAAHRAGMLAAADLLQQQWYKTQDECERVIREAAEK